MPSADKNPNASEDADEKLARAAALPLGAERARLEREAWQMQNIMALKDLLSDTDS